MTPIPGDLCYFSFAAGQLPTSIHGHADDEGTAGRERIVDLALFYGRNNLLLNVDVGFVPGNDFATVVEGSDDMAAAGNDVWRAGAIDVRLAFRCAGWVR